MDAFVTRTPSVHKPQPLASTFPAAARSHLAMAALAGCGEPDAPVTPPPEPTTPIEAAAPVAA